MTNDELLREETASLARLLEVSDDCACPWGPQELGDILAHQLDAPLVDDLGKLHKGPVALATALPSPGAPPMQTFRDLFLHRNPPLELLELVKRFAKSCRGGHERTLPDEIATVLYFLAIVLARLRRGARISGLDDEALRAGLQWALAQPWLDGSTRELLQEGLDSLPK